MKYLKNAATVGVVLAFFAGAVLMKVRASSAARAQAPRPDPQEKGIAEHDAREEAEQKVRAEEYPKQGQPADLGPLVEEYEATLKGPFRKLQFARVKDGVEHYSVFLVLDTVEGRAIKVPVTREKPVKYWLPGVTSGSQLKGRTMRVRGMVQDYTAKTGKTYPQFEAEELLSFK